MFGTVFPELSRVIKSVGERVEEIADDSKTEIRSAALDVGNFEEKLITAKRSLNLLTDTSIKSLDMFNQMLQLIKDMDLSSGLKIPSAISPEAFGKGSVRDKYRFDEKTGKWVEKSTNKPITDAEANKLKLNEGGAAKTGMGKVGGAALSAANWLAVIYTVYQGYNAIRELNPLDPDYKKNVTKIVADLTARFGVATVASTLGAIVTAPLLGPFAILSGLAAGYYADKYLGDSTDEIVNSVIDKLWPSDASISDKQKVLSQKVDTPEADLPSRRANNVELETGKSGFFIPGEKNAQVSSPVTTAKSILFKADKITFIGARNNPTSEREERVAPVSATPASPPPAPAAIAPSMNVSPPSGGSSSAGSGQSLPTFAMGGAPTSTPSKPSYAAPQRSMKAAPATPGPGQIGQFGISGVEAKDMPTNVSLGPNVDLSRVDRGLLSKFFEAAKLYGKPVNINSAYRSDEYQAQLWARWKLGEPGLYMPAKPVNPQTVNIGGKSVDVPGGGRGSAHSSGLALDVRQAPDMEAAGILSKVGLSRPFGDSDPPHIQKLGSAGAAEPQGGTGAPKPVASQNTEGKQMNDASTKRVAAMDQKPKTVINNITNGSDNKQQPVSYSREVSNDVPVKRRIQDVFGPPAAA